MSFFEVMLRFIEKVRIGVTEAVETELNGVGMYYLGKSICEDSCTTLLGVKIISVLRVHLFSVKDTKLFLKSWANNSEQSSKELSLGLIG